MPTNFESANGRQEDGSYNNAQKETDSQEVVAFYFADGFFLSDYLLSFFGYKTRSAKSNDDLNIESQTTILRDDYTPEKIISEYAKLSSEKKENLIIEISQKIQESINSGNLFVIYPQKRGDITEYESKNQEKLLQKKISEDSFEFVPTKGFNGVLKVKRRGENGKLLENSVDIIEYKDGKPVLVIPGVEGKCRIAGFGDIERVAGIVLDQSKIYSTQPDQNIAQSTTTKVKSSFVENKKVPIANAVAPNNSALLFSTAKGPVEPQKKSSQPDVVSSGVQEVNIDVQGQSVDKSIVPPTIITRKSEEDDQNIEKKTIDPLIATDVVSQDTLSQIEKFDPETSIIKAKNNKRVRSNIDEEAEPETKKPKIIIEPAKKESSEKRLIKKRAPKKVRINSKKTIRMSSKENKQDNYLGLKDLFNEVIEEKVTRIENAGSGEQGLPRYQKFEKNIEQKTASLPEISSENEEELKTNNLIPEEIKIQNASTAAEMGWQFSEGDQEDKVPEEVKSVEQEEPDVLTDIDEALDGNKEDKVVEEITIPNNIVQASIERDPEEQNEELDSEYDDDKEEKVKKNISIMREALLKELEDLEKKYQKLVQDFNEDKFDSEHTGTFFEHVDSIKEAFEVYKGFIDKKSIVGIKPVLNSEDFQSLLDHAEEKGKILFTQESMVLAKKKKELSLLEEGVKSYQQYNDRVIKEVENDTKFDFEGVKSYINSLKLNNKMEAARKILDKELQELQGIYFALNSDNWSKNSKIYNDQLSVVRAKFSEYQNVLGQQDEIYQKQIDDLEKNYDSKQDLRKIREDQKKLEKLQEDLKVHYTQEGFEGAGKSLQDITKKALEYFEKYPENGDFGKSSFVEWGKNVKNSLQDLYDSKQDLRKIREDQKKLEKLQEDLKVHYTQEGFEGAGKSLQDITKKVLEYFEKYPENGDFGKSSFVEWGKNVKNSLQDLEENKLTHELEDNIKTVENLSENLMKKMSDKAKEYGEAYDKLQENLIKYREEFGLDLSKEHQLRLYDIDQVYQDMRTLEKIKGSREADFSKEHDFTKEAKNGKSNRGVFRT
jgi:hypothetical protein